MPLWRAELPRRLLPWLLTLTILVCPAPAMATPLAATMSAQEATPEQEAAPGQEGAPEQEAAADSEQQAGSDALRVFLDCQFRCDQEYIRQNIAFINWVRNREDSQVHVLVTIQRTGAGREYLFSFIGRDEFEGQDQELRFSSSDTDTDDETRAGYSRILRLGLARYLAQIPGGEGIDLEADEDNGTVRSAATPEDDPWNFWIFSIGGNAFLNSEQRFDSQSYSGRISANRTTEEWKSFISASADYGESNFELDDGETVRDTRRSFDFGGQAVKSLGPKWGAGLGFSMRRSTFFNLDPSYRVAAALEYNIFPYAESSRRELTFAYFIGGTQFNYEEETIFELTEETLADQGLIVGLDLEQPWGSARFDVQFSHFLNEPGEFNIEVGGNLEYRILRGLSVDLFGNYSRIRTQRFLAKRGATDEEVLLRRRALETDYRFFVGIGLRYTFGSIYNNVVNARLSGRARGFHTIF